MKISSLKNEFDQFDQDFEIDETTICADLGIDPQKIADNVLQTIAEPTVKKNKRRFITVFVAAAALSITAVCSTVIATSGVLRPDFTDVYQGDISALEIRGTETFEFAPLDQNLQAEFIPSTSAKRTAHPLRLRTAFRILPASCWKNCCRKSKITKIILSDPRIILSG